MIDNQKCLFEHTRANHFLIFSHHDQLHWHSLFSVCDAIVECETEHGLFLQFGS